MARANIKDMVKNQIEQGAELIEKSTGLFVKNEKIEEMATKALMAEVKAKTVTLAKCNVAAYIDNYKKVNFVKANNMLILIGNMLSGRYMITCQELSEIEDDEDPEPSEEPVTQE